MFGCYRRTEAADPSTYVGAVALVLLRYSAEVVTAVTDPFSGLPARKTESGYSGLPDVADVKQACEDEAARLQRMANYRALGRTEFRRLPAPRDTRPGCLANVLVHKGAPQYAKLVTTDRFGTPQFSLQGADPRLWKWDEDGRGIWVVLSLFDEGQAIGLNRFKGYSDDELRAMYAPKPAPDPDPFPVKHGEAAA